MLPTERPVKLFVSAHSVASTGYTIGHLRDWSRAHRQNLMPAAVLPDGLLGHTLFSWQTILVRRLLHELRDDFTVELDACAHGIVDLRHYPYGISFPSISGTRLRVRIIRHCYPFIRQNVLLAQSYDHSDSPPIATRRLFPPPIPLFSSQPLR